MVVCPKCRKPYTGRPALSRVDNKTDICPDCGMREAIESIPGMNDRKRIDPAERTRRLVQSTGNRWAMGKFQCNTQLRSGGDEVPGKITVRNYTTLTDYAALLRAGMYLAGKKEEAEDNGFRFKVTESERHGVVVKIAEVDK